MFLIIIILLVVGNMYFEFKICKALHIDGLSKKFVLLNLAISVLISIATGMMFPAAGMTIAASGILSTVLSSPMYACVDAFNEHIRPNFILVKEGWEKNKTSIIQSAKDLLKVLSIVVFIITFPFKVLRWLIQLQEKLFVSRKAVPSS